MGTVTSLQVSSTKTSGSVEAWPVLVSLPKSSSRLVGRNLKSYINIRYELLSSGSKYLSNQTSQYLEEYTAIGVDRPDPYK